MIGEWDLFDLFMFCEIGRCGVMEGMVWACHYGFLRLACIIITW